MGLGAKKIAVVGLGKSGMAAVRFFAKQGCHVFASDVKPPNPGDPAYKELASLGVAMEWGGNTRKILEADLIIVSPGVDASLPLLQEARARKIPVWPEIEAAYRYCPGPLIAITGTNGKSTVAALVGHLMNSNGVKARVVGNIGVPLLDEIETMTPDTWAVMEVSSFQLETIVDFRPRIACVITVTQDHLNRHPDLKTYVEAKARILENQTTLDTAVLNAEDPVVQGFAKKAKGKIIWFGKSLNGEGIFLDGTRVVWGKGDSRREIADIRDFPLPGEHNQRNFLAAAAICFAAGLTSLPKGISSFKSLPHRLEFTASMRGVDFYDDSKGTNPDAVAAALKSLDKPVVLIGGGYDKNLDLTPLLAAARGKVKSFIALGKDNAKFLEAFSFLPASDRADTHRMEDAVASALKLARHGDAVLLSPGCASFDLFQSAEERGEKFQECVRRLSHETQAS